MEGRKNADGTYTFKTGHFSIYAVMTAEEADKVIAEQEKAKIERIKAGVKATTIKASSSAKKGPSQSSGRRVTDTGWTISGIPLHEEKQWIRNEGLLHHKEGNPEELQEHQETEKGNQILLQSERR